LIKKYRAGVVFIAYQGEQSLFVWFIASNT